MHRPAAAIQGSRISWTTSPRERETEIFFILNFLRRRRSSLAPTELAPLARALRPRLGRPPTAARSKIYVYKITCLKSVCVFCTNSQTRLFFAKSKVILFFAAAAGGLRGPHNTFCPGEDGVFSYPIFSQSRSCSFRRSLWVSPRPNLASFAAHKHMLCIGKAMTCSCLNAQVCSVSYKPYTVLCRTKLGFFVIKHCVRDGNLIFLKINSQHNLKPCILLLSQEGWFFWNTSCSWTLLVSSTNLKVNITKKTF